MAMLAIGALVVISLIAAPFARVPLGSFPGFVTLYGGAVLMGMAIATTILFGQFAMGRRPSLLVLACATLFAAIVFVPYVLTVPGVAAARRLGALESTSTYLWLIWHTALPVSYVASLLLGRAEGRRGVTRRATAAAVIATIAGAFAAVLAVFTFGAVMPALVAQGRYLGGTYVGLALVAVLSATALALLAGRRRPTAIEAWLVVPAAAFLCETLLTALGGGNSSVAWYVSRLDILVATTFLIVVLLAEMNRLARRLAVNERRLRGIVDGVADALVAIDAHDAIASVNRAASALFRFAPHDLAGLPVERILPRFTSIRADEGTVTETEGRDARGCVFPIELGFGPHASRGERLLIVRDVTQRTAAQDAIRAAHDRAVEALSVKSQFLATMSHEIRTPINAVVGMSELMLQVPLSDEAREYATTVRDSAESLLGIVNDVLDFSDVETGRLRLEHAPFAPLGAVENAADILASAARKKELSLSTHVARDVPAYVAGDAGRLRQVLLNLIGNAVKFTETGSVDVRLTVERGRGDDVVLRFAVSDTGPGIAPELGARLFEPFRQADQTTRRRFGGAGLGLSISRHIVELMGGRIGYESTPGAGSTFWFAIPFPRVAAQRASDPNEPLRGVRVLIVDEDPEACRTVERYLMAWGAVAARAEVAAHAVELAKGAAARGTPFEAIVLDADAGGDAFAFAARLRQEGRLPSTPLVLLGGAERGGTRVPPQETFAAVVRKPVRQSVLHDALVAALAPDARPRARESAVESGAGRSIQVLVAEDNPVNRKLALQQLKKLGYAAHAVADGREAVAAVATGAYSLVLMDCQMPEVDGFEATRSIRRAEAAGRGHVPIVAMTANALDGDRDACLAAGMDDYLAKPVQLSALRAAVERFTGGIGIAG